MSATAARRPIAPLVIALGGDVLAALLAGPRVASGFGPGSDASYDAARLVAVYATLPRLATALLAGAALALAGAIFQQVLRNPLASPTTLGISAGANLTLVLATLFLPSALAFGREFVALAGSAAVALLVLGLGMRRGFSPLALVLSGLVISLWCGALAAVLVFFNERTLVSLFIWGAGSLAVQDWSIPLKLLWQVGALAVLSLLFARPLGLLDLGDTSASALGVKVAALRLGSIAIAVALTAVVTSAVGVIGFIGLVAPAIARLAGARRVLPLLVWSSLIGAALLFLADASLQTLAGSFGDYLPTGAVTALFGTPVLLFLLPRLKLGHRVIAASNRNPRRRFTAQQAAAIVLPLLVLVALMAILFGRSIAGDWEWLWAGMQADLLALRMPRVVAAFASGAMLAVAGVLLQRLTGNEMASPEVLGISAGATFGLAVGLFVTGIAGFGGQAGFAGIGAFSVLGIILLFAARANFAPERVLLAGIALSAMVDALVGLLAVLGDPRALLLLRWMTGSTYSADGNLAVALSISAIVLIGLALLARRWLDLIPLGPAPATAVGMSLSRSRLALYGLAGLLSAVATIGVGPLSFIGLMGPHLARELGLTRALPQTAGAAVIGGTLLLLADWLGRTLVFPYQIPAGLMSALIGAPFLILLLSRRTQA